jgi:lipopolysaccharide/colanic/teichoic acid biosynthesis glycosyltransferase
MAISARAERGPDVRDAALPAMAPFVASRRKRGLDVALALTALGLTAPLSIAIALAIRATSPGPVLFRQQRLTLGGRPFTMFKFRTMYDGVSDEAHREYVTTMIASDEHVVRDGQSFKLHGDGRVTSVGRWLRRYSLDELPQLLNVLRGEMSIVGPRPALDYEVARYEPWQLERLSVKPGITGHWQVSGRNRLTYAEMCRLDIDYIRGWSFTEDLWIVIRTPWVMVTNSGGAE